MVLRPHVREFLQAMAKIYEVHVCLFYTWNFNINVCFMSKMLHLFFYVHCSCLYILVLKKNTLRRSWRSLILRRSSSGNSAFDFLANLTFPIFKRHWGVLIRFFSCRHRLYQDDCACVLGHYIKDLSILGRDLTKTVVLDNAPHTYPYHVRKTLFMVLCVHKSAVLRWFLHYVCWFCSLWTRYP